MKQKHCWKYFAFNQSYLAEGKIAPVVLLPQETNQKYLILHWWTGLERAIEFQKFCRSALDRIQFCRIKTGLGLKNFAVRSSLVCNSVAQIRDI